MRNLRAQTALQEIIAESEDATYIGITTHSEVIQSALVVLGRLRAGVSTGGILPVAVKVEFGDSPIDGYRGGWYEARITGPSAQAPH